MRLAMSGRLQRNHFLLMIGGAVLPVLVSAEGNPMLLEPAQGRCLMTYTASAVAPEEMRTGPIYPGCCGCFPPMSR
ncbi:hypothetical protein GTS_54680 [Gandjariella thermophila]|uniref:Uncharacterized protein n=1 Tax=Gandjariella thermophila TaxID=1931992 RepID=A0A4D4JAJ3_9PSEU|nr:hypothetical protein GTS_54680 [Gandjariella thermophila]